MVIFCLYIVVKSRLTSSYRAVASLRRYQEHSFVKDGAGLFWKGGSRYGPTESGLG